MENCKTPLSVIKQRISEKKKSKDRKVDPMVSQESLSDSHGISAVVDTTIPVDQALTIPDPIPVAPTKKITGNDRREKKVNKRGRLPHGSVMTATYDAENVSWEIKIVIGDTKEVIETNSSGLFPGLDKLNRIYWENKKR